MDLERWSDALQSTFERATENKTAAAVGAVAGGVVVISGVYFLYRSRSNASRSKPRATDLAGGTIDRKAVRKAFVDYSSSYGKEAGVGIVEKDGVPRIVNTFYNLVTDFYEWGWGESFHFSSPLPGKSDSAAEAVAEARVAVLCKLRSGMKCIDLGCGVGGPMRTIASCSGAEVTGVTINHYQVDRANYHNRRYKVDSLCKAVQGSFLSLDFPDNSFDAGYAIEATCHAPDISVVYSEAFRVLKPGSMFVSYEWVTTPLFDSTNPLHVKAIDDINYGNGLPDMRSIGECISAAKRIGFEVVAEYDLAQESKVCEPWYERLERVYSKATLINRLCVNVLSTLHLLPSGMKQVHDMLVDSAAKGLVIAGKEGIFTPMHMAVFQKPKA